MIRIFLENIALFLLPTVVYVAYALVTKRAADGPVRLMDGAPLIWLFVLGALIVVTTLLTFSSTTGGRPGEVYLPSIFKDGKIVPAPRP